MGNCSACCGNKDTNEIVTEKQMKGKGAANEGNAFADGRQGKGDMGKYSTSPQTNQGRKVESLDEFRNGDLEINNDAYNNPRVMVPIDDQADLTYRKF